jgi:hypothetical protein
VYSQVIIVQIMYGIQSSKQTCIQANKQSKVKVLAKRGSNYIYIIPKSWEWLIVNYVMNGIGEVLLRFYIFKAERLRNDFIKFYMVIQKKIWMTCFLFEKIFSFLKQSILGGIFTTIHHLLILDKHGSHFTF